MPLCHNSESPITKALKVSIKIDDDGAQKLADFQPQPAPDVAKLLPVTKLSTLFGGDSAPLEEHVHIVVQPTVPCELQLILSSIVLTNSSIFVISHFPFMLLFIPHDHLGFRFCFHFFASSPSHYTPLH